MVLHEFVFIPLTLIAAGVLSVSLSTFLLNVFPLRPTRRMYSDAYREWTTVEEAPTSEVKALKRHRRKRSLLSGAGILMVLSYAAWLMLSGELSAQIDNEVERSQAREREQVASLIENTESEFVEPLSTDTATELLSGVAETGRGRTSRTTRCWSTAHTRPTLLRTSLASGSTRPSVSPPAMRVCLTQA